MNKNQTEFEALLQQQLAESVEQIDAANLSRLNQARQAALVNVNKSSFMFPIWSTGIAASIAGIFMIYLALPVGIDIQQGLEDPLASIALFEQEELDLYEELDFYQWLEQQHG